MLPPLPHSTSSSTATSKPVPSPRPLPPPIPLLSLPYRPPNPPLSQNQSFFNLRFCDLT